MFHLFCQVYDRSLEEEILNCKTSEDFRSFLTLILKHQRNETSQSDMISAEEQAKLLFRSGETQLSVGEAKLDEMMAQENFNQLRLIFDEYKRLSHQTIHLAIRRSVQGELARAMLAIGKILNTKLNVCEQK